MKDDSIGESFLQDVECDRVFKERQGAWMCETIYQWIQALDYQKPK